MSDLHFFFLRVLLMDYARYVSNNFNPYFVKTVFIGKASY